MTSMLNRRTALSLGVPALAVVFSACANTTSNSGRVHPQAVAQVLTPAQAAQQAALPRAMLPAALAPGERQAHPVRLRPPRVTPPK